MSELCIFAGTTEGRRLAELLAGQPVRVLACVATEYGETLIPQGENIEVSAGRLDGEAIETKKTSDIISDGIAPGSVQIPASGKPIVLMADRQTTGGYAKIATVFSGDLWRLAQARPGTRVTFRRIELAAAQKLHARAEKEYRRLARGKGWINR